MPDEVHPHPTCIHPTLEGENEIKTIVTPAAELPRAALPCLPADDNELTNTPTHLPAVESSPGEPGHDVVSYLP